MVFLRLPIEKGIKCLSFGNDSVTVDEIRCHIVSYWGIDDFKLDYNGKLLEGQHVVPRDATVQATFSLPGGKGGFGSMLRAIGAQIEKTTNREACRDLSGRRLRDINEEQRLKKWIAKESEREAEKARRRQARLERLKSKPKHNFVDFEYEKEISQLPERVDEALHAGMEKASKRPKTVEACSAPPSKKKKLWLDEDLSGSSDSDSQEASSSSGNANSRTDNAHSSRSEASGSESSNDSLLSEAKHDDTTEKEVPMVVHSEEETSLNASQENQQVSSNADVTPDQMSLNVTIMQEETEAPQDQGTVNTNATQELASSRASTTEEQMTSNTNAEASCSSSKNDDEKETDSSGKVKNNADSQPAVEAEIENRASELSVSSPVE
ncbi:Replication stress response regulator SDE2 [Araneus ventricosus]|uniref:Replication stress response regulator SDE2 n=1 Tax=Araneus ventricosus TaxID=182803 RepID=A0A4Y2T3I4_ARAVE|nr:Replication stress response regulator SDE2 [Araneus ventricosus]